MKVVINACFGGFSLSSTATEAIAKRKGVSRLYWFTNKRKADGGIDFDEYVLTDRPDEDFIAFAFTTPEPPDRNDNKGWRTKNFDRRDFDRHDPDLVAVVEELGKAANGKCAELRVVEIPDGIKYVIEEYDGLEHVAEEHRTWS